MNKNVLALCGVALALSSGMASAVGTVSTVYGGKILFDGSVVDAACAVTATTIPVDMGQIRTASIDLGPGTQSAARVPFEIVLNDCNPTVSTQAAVSFSGVIDTTAAAGVDAGTAIIAGKGPGSSNGVALQIFDLAGKPVVVDNTTKSAAINLIPGKNVMMFQVGFVSLVPQGSVIPGDASAIVDFNMNYF
ncbi:fimbrial protein [Pseudomonas palleroniana]